MTINNSGALRGAIDAESATVRHSVPKEEKLADTGKTQGKPQKALADTGRKSERGEFKSRAKLICMADVESQPISWLWEGRIARGRMSLLVGMPGIGKSFLTTDMAARVSTGTPWPDRHPCERGSVLFVTAEDDPRDTIKPRLDAARADSRRVQLLAGVIYSDGKDESERMFDLKSVDILDQTLAAMSDCRLVIIDPIGSFLGGGTDSHRDNEVRSVLAPVAQIAERYGVAMLVVAHRRKATSTSADDMAIGSRAFTGLARSVWHLSKDNDNDERRLFLPGKNNLAKRQAGLAFTIAGEPASIRWEKDPVDMSADEALQGESNGDSAVAEAVKWLREALDDGAVEGKQLRKDARADGIAERTLERAKKVLKVENGPDGFGGPWKWKLPESAKSLPVSRTESATESAKKSSKNPYVYSVSPESANLFITEDDPWPN